jgi:hypothetical protein
MTLFLATRYTSRLYDSNVPLANTGIYCFISYYIPVPKIFWCNKTVSPSSTHLVSFTAFSASLDCRTFLALAWSIWLGCCGPPAVSTDLQ